MKKSSRNNSIYVLLIVAFFAIGCGFGNIKAEKDESAQPEQIKKEDELAANSDQTKTELQTQTVSSVVGKYHYKTNKDGEGYDNSLEITDAGDGKLYVYLSGTYNYTNNGNESFHEAEGKGDATMRGNIANSTLVDEAGKPCRATITFRVNEATVKIPDNCQFNIELGGIYKRGIAKSIAKKAKSASKTREILFAELNDVVNNIAENKAGERLIVTGVPASAMGTFSRASPFGDMNYKNLFASEARDEDGGVSRFITSKRLAQNLEHNAEREPATLRITTVIVEAVGNFDVDRKSFVTKVEGLSEDGTVIWTADGEEPTKVKFKS